jgi:signal transduction histidine kinase/ligand-binding sensor domain-containing protein
MRLRLGPSLTPKGIHPTMQRVIKSRLSLFLFLTLILTASSALALDPSRRLTQYAHTAWTVRDGYLPGGPIALAQTTDGYLWIGTGSGLVRFDGARFDRWGPPNGEDLRFAAVFALLAARDGSLWIGGISVLAHLTADGRLTKTQLAGPVRRMVEDADGAIFVTRGDSSSPPRPVCRIAESTLRCFGAAEGVVTQGTASMFTIAADQQGGFWLGADTGLIHWNGRSSAVYAPEALKSNIGQIGVSMLATTKAGTLLAAGHSLGLQYIVHNSLRPFPVPNLDTSKLSAYAVYVDRADSVWVGTAREGLYRITATTVDHFDAANGLSSNSVWGFFEDREGNLWVTTTAGVDCFRDTVVGNFTKAEGLGSDEVDGVVATRDGTIWVSGSQSLDTIRQGTIRSIRKSDGLPGLQVTSILEDHQGRMWVGVDNGLYMYRGGTFRPLRMPDGSHFGLVRAIAEDIDSDIWVETLGQATRLLRLHDLRVKEVLSSSQVPAARRLAADPRGGIWLGLMDGRLAHYVGGKLDIIPLLQSKTWPGQIAVDADGSLLAATTSGLVRVHDGAIQFLSTNNGLPCDEVNGFISDQLNGFWLYTQCGLVRLAKSDIQAWRQRSEIQLHPTRVLDTFDGVQARAVAFSQIALSSDGRLWFAYETGLGMIDPARLSENKIPPPVDIKAVVADHKTYVKGQGLRLPPLIRDLEIDYTALSFVEPQKVYFRYKLEGRESDWRDAGTRRQAFYTDLAPGVYRFRVIACNNDGVWNEQGASLDFSIAPAYWQTRWFVGLCAAAFMGLLWALYQLRLRQLARQYGMRLEERVSERTRIARELHDTLLQSFHGLLLRLQTASELLSTRPAEAKQTLDGAIDQAAQAITEGRDAVQGLRGSVVESNDLAVAIRTFGEELAAEQAGNGSVVLHVVVEGTPRTLHPIVRDEIYRIACEALRNAFKHADATQIEVELRYDERQLRVRVRDDGRGIDPQFLTEEGRAGHYGLHGMRERARLMGGKLTVRSALESGAEVELSIPAARAYATSASTWRSWFAKKFSPGRRAGRVLKQRCGSDSDPVGG